MIKVTIHAKPNVPWQKRLGPLVVNGLKKHNVQVTMSDVSRHTSDVAIILGPNYWKPIENSGKPYIMMNRKFIGFGDRDVHDNVAISWDGFNGRGTFCVDEIDPDRFHRYVKEDEFMEWRTPGKNYLICEQADTGRCKQFTTPTQWYAYVEQNVKGPLKRRKKVHPVSGKIPTFKRGLIDDLKITKAAIVLNSTVSTEILLFGTPVISMDKGDPTYPINSHSLNIIIYPDRLPFFQYLAHCQWHYDEIKNGNFWAQIYPKRGPKLCEWKNV